jgi:hypothetical protein
MNGKNCLTCIHAKIDFPTEAFCTLLPIWVYISTSEIRSVGFDNLKKDPQMHYCSHYFKKVNTG